MFKNKVFKAATAMMLVCSLAGCGNIGAPPTSGSEEPSFGEGTSQTEVKMPSTIPTTTEVNEATEPTTLPTTQTTSPVETTVPETTSRGEVEEPTTEVPTNEPTTPPETMETTQGTTVSVTTVPTTEGPTVPPTTESTDPTEVTVPVETTTPRETEATVPTATEPATTAPTTEVTTSPTTVETTEPSVPTTAAPVETTVPVTTVPLATTVPATAHVHNYTDTVVVATCSKDGYTLHQCACGHSYKDEETEAVGHQWGEWETRKEPSVFSTGEDYHVCSACGSKEYQETEMLTKEESEKKVAELFLMYINQFRLEDGGTDLTYLPGMSQVAQYRSKQLVTNFTHDAHDMREALACYKYGKYVDMTQYNYDESFNYYEADSQEAIGMNPNEGTPEAIALGLANACRKSQGHWRYVGSSENSFAGVGVTFADGKHYICIIVGRTNFG